MAKILFRWVLTENDFIPGKMRKATKCGRLIRLRNGSTKHIKVSEDGGSRSCSLIDDSMNFVRVHYHLRRFFHIRKLN